MKKSTLSTLFVLVLSIVLLAAFSGIAAAEETLSVYAWNAYMWPRVVLNRSNAQTMPILIANLANGYTIDYGMLMMGVLFCSLPTVIIFFVLQKQFAEGITGAVK